MKTKLLVIISLLFVGGDCFGQVIFQRIITLGNYAVANEVRQTSDSGYIIIGTTQDTLAANTNIYLVKTSSAGDTLWTKTFNEFSDSYGYSIQQTTDGGYILAATADSIGQVGNIYIVKTNSLGDTLWTKTYTGGYVDGAPSIQQTKDSGYVIAGTVNGFVAGGVNVYLIKLGVNGDLSWTKTYGGSLGDEGRCVKQTFDSGYIICGITYSFGDGSSDVYLIKTNGNGDTLWTKTYGGLFEDVGADMQQTADSGYIIVGTTSSFGVPGGALYLIKTNVIGDTLWTKTYTAPYDGGGNSVQQTSDGGYIIVGATSNLADSSSDVYLIKTYANGNTSWSKTYGGTNEDLGKSVQQTTDGGYIIAGFTESVVPSQPTEGIYLIKTDANGNSGCNQNDANTVFAPAPTLVGSTNTIVGPGGTVSFTNTTIGSGGNDSAICLTTGINELSNNNIISLYPNPTNDQLIIAGNWKANQNYLLTITDLLGETIYTQVVGSKQETVNCKPFPPGIYFVRIADDKESWVGKFVKE